LTEELDQIFRDHHQLIYRTAYGVTGSPEDAQDVLQTIFLRLLRSELHPGLRENPKAYLYRAAVNLSLNTVRQRKRRVATDVEEHLEEVAPVAESDSLEELHRRLYEAIAQLEPEAAQILILRYVHHSSIADIAKLLGKSSTAIAVRLFRTRARLKEIIRASREGKS
jgi:RNA polymerase sigma-70 factor (ECF subfamily)